MPGGHQTEKTTTATATARGGSARVIAADPAPVKMGYSAERAGTIERTIELGDGEKR
jgi:hypothetical protein